MAEQILVTTTENIPGRKYETIGEVFGDYNSIKKCN